MSEKRRRTAEDALKDPRPGDVFRVRKGITKFITADKCRFGYKYEGPGSDAPPMPQWDEDWRGPWRKYAADAEVLHVAHEGGEE